MSNTINEAEVRAMLGRNLERLRVKQNFSQSKLAAKAGLPSSFIKDIEQGKKWLSPKTLAALATALDIEPHELFEPEAPKGDATAMAEHLDNLAGDVLRWVEDIKGRCLKS
jgi:transcriptional regulator with XRE-family HTH domain